MSKSTCPVLKMCRSRRPFESRIIFIRIFPGRPSSLAIAPHGRHKLRPAPGFLVIGGGVGRRHDRYRIAPIVDPLEDSDDVLVRRTVVQSQHAAGLFASSGQNVRREGSGFHFFPSRFHVAFPERLVVRSLPIQHFQLPQLSPKLLPLFHQLPTSDGGFIRAQQSRLRVVFHSSCIRLFILILVIYDGPCIELVSEQPVHSMVGIASTTTTTTVSVLFRSRLSKAAPKSIFDRYRFSVVFSRKRFHR